MAYSTGAFTRIVRINWQSNNWFGMQIFGGGVPFSPFEVDFPASPAAPFAVGNAFQPLVGVDPAPIFAPYMQSMDNRYTITAADLVQIIKTPSGIAYTAIGLDTFTDLGITTVMLFKMDRRFSSSVPFLARGFGGAGRTVTCFTVQPRLLAAGLIVGAIGDLQPVSVQTANPTQRGGGAFSVNPVTLAVTGPL